MRVSTKEVLRAPGHELSLHFREELPSFQQLLSPEADEVSPVEVTAVIRHLNGAYHADGWVEASVRLSCSRCLAPFTLHLRGRLDEEYRESGALSTGAGEDEIRPIAEGWIDLEPGVSESLVLQMPLAPQCKADCSGLCPRCGVNWNLSSCNCAQEETDLRWEGLKKLFE